MTGIPNGLFLPLDLGIKTLFSGRGLYPFRLSLNIASHFDAGVLQIWPSTPGVLRPLFSVTRFTASALALNERTSSHCSLPTVRHCWLHAAFAILVCMVLTC